MLNYMSSAAVPNAIKYHLTLLAMGIRLLVTPRGRHEGPTPEKERRES